MLAKKYFSTNNKEQKKQLRKEIQETSSSTFDDIKSVIKQYIKKNITKKSMTIQKKKYNITECGDFSERNFQMNYTCLLDLKNVGKNDFDKTYQRYIQQKKQIPEIQADIQLNIKDFVESKKYVKAYYYIKQQYNMSDDQDIINKMRNIIYQKIKEEE